MPTSKRPTKTKRLNLRVLESLEAELRQEALVLGYHPFSEYVRVVLAERDYAKIAIRRRRKTP